MVDWLRLRKIESQREIQSERERGREKDRERQRDRKIEREYMVPQVLSVSIYGFKKPVPLSPPIDSVSRDGKAVNCLP